MPGPHIILFLSDQHRADVLGAGGDPVVRTPVLDRLAGEGGNFRQAYCNAPVCGPSRMSLLTSRMPGRTGVLTNRAALPSDIPTMAHAFAAAGYDTVLCGRMHFIGPDQSHGFTERLVGDIGPVDPAFREAPQGPFDYTTGQHRSTLAVSGSGCAPAEIYDATVVAAAIARMEQQDPDRPLFLVIGTYAPHNPYVCREDLYAFYRDALPGVSKEEIQSFRNTTHPMMQEWIRARGMDEVEAEEVDRSRAAYYGMVETMDSLIGEVVEAVDRVLGPDRTFFSYCSDHGDLAGQYGLFWKSNFLEGSVRVPWICRGPGIRPGGVIETPVSLLDLAPTLLDLAGLPNLPGAGGMSLKPFLETDSPPPERPIVSVLADPRCGPSAMVRSGPWKLIYGSRRKESILYHLETNPSETGGGEPPGEEAEKALVRLSAFLPDERLFRQMEEAIQEGPERAKLFSAIPPSPENGTSHQWQVDLARLRCRTDLADGEVGP